MKVSTSLGSDWKMSFFLQEQEKFYSLTSLIESQSTLTIPLSENAPSKKPWFWGDISSSEANRLLANQNSGTFCFRFSSTGQYAASFLTIDKQVGHCLVSKTQSGKLVLQQLEGKEFSDLDAMIDSLTKEVIFTQPLSKVNQQLLQTNKQDEANYFSALLKEIENHKNTTQRRRAQPNDMTPFSINVVDPALKKDSTLQASTNSESDVLYESFAYLSEHIHLLVQAYPHLSQRELLEFARVFRASSNVISEK